VDFNVPVNTNCVYPNTPTMGFGLLVHVCVLSVWVDVVGAMILCGTMQVSADCKHVRAGPDDAMARFLCCVDSLNHKQDITDSVQKTVCPEGDRKEIRLVASDCEYCLFSSWFCTGGFSATTICTNTTNNVSYQAAVHGTCMLSKPYLNSTKGIMIQPKSIQTPTANTSTDLIDVPCSSVSPSMEINDAKTTTTTTKECNWRGTPVRHWLYWWRGIKTCECQIGWTGNNCETPAYLQLNFSYTNNNLNNWTNSLSCATDYACTVNGHCEHVSYSPGFLAFAGPGAFDAFIYKIPPPYGKRVCGSQATQIIEHGIRDANYSYGDGCVVPLGGFDPQIHYASDYEE